jgi:hypothetical protein
MPCRGLHRVANAAYLRGFLFPALPCVAPYCVPGGVRVVSGGDGLRVASSFSNRSQTTVLKPYAAAPRLRPRCVFILPFAVLQRLSYAARRPRQVVRACGLGSRFAPHLADARALASGIPRAPHQPATGQTTSVISMSTCAVLMCPKSSQGYDPTRFLTASFRGLPGKRRTDRP